MSYQDHMAGERLASRHETNAGIAPIDLIGRWLSPVATYLLKTNRLNQIAFVGFALFVLGLFGASFAKPIYNWDMSAYFATTLREMDPTLTNDQLHQQSWSLVKEIAPAGDYADLTQSNGYRAHMIDNPDDFISMLPMYEVKIGYLAAAKFLTPFLGLAQSYYLISSLSLLLMGSVILYWMTRGGFLQAAPLAAAGLLILSYFKLGLNVTPDLPAAAFCVWGCERVTAKRPWTGVLLMLVGFTVRPDMLLFLFAFLLGALLFRRYILPAIVGFGIALASYLFITSGTHHPGWWVHFYFACVEIQNSLIGFDPDFSLTAYISGVARGIAIGLRDHDWWAVLAICLAGWALLVRHGKGPDRIGTQMILTCLMAIGGKFILFPMPEDRFYIAYLVVLMMVLLSAWKPTYDQRSQIE